jgi:uncharacterized membrane protein
MPLLSQIGLIFGAYLATGRVGAVAACMFSGISAWETLIIAVLIDLFQIPVYGFFLETSHSRIRLSQRVQQWVSARSQRLEKRMASSRLWRHMSRFQPMAVVAVSLLPFRGFGIFSACILAFMLSYNRFYATLLIMGGSLLGALLAVLVFFFPARWVHVF